MRKTSFYEYCKENNKEYLLDEWDYKKNKETPDTVSYGSHKNIFWVCKEGHEYPCRVFHRTAGRGCPYCSGQKVLKGYNDLVTTYPEIVAEWDYEKNGDLKPEDFTPKSHRNVFWICEKGHSYQTKISNRTDGKGCKHCASSKGEKKIENFLKEINAEYKTQNIEKDRGQLRDDFVLIREDKVIGAIEYNGRQHYEPVDFAGRGQEWAKEQYEIIQKRDDKKTSYWNNKKIPQLIIPYWEFDNVLGIIENFCKEIGAVAS